MSIVSGRPRSFLFGRSPELVADKSGVYGSGRKESIASLLVDNNLVDGKMTIGGDCVDFVCVSGHVFC